MEGNLYVTSGVCPECSELCPQFRVLPPANQSAGLYQRLRLQCRPGRLTACTDSHQSECSTYWQSPVRMSDTSQYVRHTDTSQSECLTHWQSPIRLFDTLAVASCLFGSSCLGHYPGSTYIVNIPKSSTENCHQLKKGEHLSTQKERVEGQWMYSCSIYIFLGCTRHISRTR